MPLKKQKCEHQTFSRVKHKRTQTAITQYLWTKPKQTQKPGYTIFTLNIYILESITITIQIEQQCCHSETERLARILLG